MKIVVETYGGVIVEVHRLGEGFEWDGVWYVLDWDDIDLDARKEWFRMAPELRAFIKEKYPDEFHRHFWHLAVGGG